MTASLVSLLKLLGFDTSHLPKSGLFKTPDKKLFHKFFLFLIGKIECLPEKETFFKTYSNYSAITAVSAAYDAGYRSSIIDLVNKLNSLYPEFPIKIIGQSYIKVPQGNKIVVFFTDICKTVLFSISKNLGEPYGPPSSDSEIDEFLSSHDCIATPEELNSQLEDLIFMKKPLIAEKQDEIIQSNMQFRKLVESSFLASDLKDRLISDKVEESEVAFNELQHNTQTHIDLAQSDVVKCEAMNQSLHHLNTNFLKIKELQKFSMQLQSVLKETESISEIEVEVKLDLESLLKISIEKVSIIKEQLCFNKIMTNHKELLALLDLLDQECCNLNNNITNAKKTNEQFAPLVRDIVEKRRIEMAESNDPLDLEIMEFINSLRPMTINNYEGEEIPQPDIELPVPAIQLAFWLSGELLEDRPKSIKKSLVKSFGGTPKLGRMLTSRKLNMFKKASEENFLPPKFNLDPLVGIPLDRRATLASPMAQRERYKIKHIDDKREPLKPMVNKVLFPTSSSPISELKEVISFGDESTINNITDSVCNIKAAPCTSQTPDLNVSDLVVCSANLPVEKVFDISKELLLWNQSSSDESDLLELVDNNQSVSSHNSPDSELNETDITELNDSRKQLISRYYKLKESLSK